MVETNLFREDWRLFFGALFSVGLHLLLLVIFSFGSARIQAIDGAPVPLRAKIVGGSVSTPALAKALIDTNHRVQPQGAAETRVVQKKMGWGGLASSLVANSADLDQVLVIETEPELEPAYGFSDDAQGLVVLNVLISDSGAVVWVGVSEAALDLGATEYLVKAFGSAKFSQPLVHGRPVYTMIQVEVGVGRP